MKKLLVAIIAILYMASSSGVAMEIHYCMGKKSGVEFYGSTNVKCGKCGMTEKKGCCQDKHQFYKLKDAHKTVSGNEIPEISIVAISTNFVSFNYHVISTLDDNAFKNHSPPQFTKPSTCILNCNFRI